MKRALLSLLALTALPGVAAADERPIRVTGHAWAPFISPMGEPFRPHSIADNGLAKWFALADSNRDGWLTQSEMQGDANRFFLTLDLNRDGKIDPPELVEYEWEVAPDIQVNARTRRTPAEAAAAPEPRAKAGQGRWESSLDDARDRDKSDQDRRRREQQQRLQGAARYALLNIPEPVAAADLDFDRDISLAEFEKAARDRFQLLDTAHAGQLSLAGLETYLAAAQKEGRKHKHRGDDEDDARIATPME